MNKVIIRRPAFNPILLDKPPSIVGLLDKLDYIVPHKGQLSLLPFEIKLGFV